MKLYNKEYKEIQNEKIKTIIEQSNLKVIDYLVTNYNVDRKILETRINNLNIVLFSSVNDTTYYKKINGEMREYNIEDNFIAFSVDTEHIHKNYKNCLKNSIFIDPTNITEDLVHIYIHELCHHLSKDDVQLFDENNTTFYKTGFSYHQIDIDDNILKTINKGINEGITENLAINITNQNLEIYNIQVLLAQILMLNQNIVDIYFSNDINMLRKFLEDFEKKQSYASKNDINSISTCNDYVPSINLLYGLVSYVINSCKTLKELNEKIQIIQSILNKIQKKYNIKIFCSSLFHDVGKHLK